MLRHVWTSRDSKHWTLESALKYYPDGKLLRREIRLKDLMLQGLDYAYTLDGWLKAINSEILANDPSKDGISGKFQHFARDVFSLLLRYYPNDYKPIKSTATPLEAFIDTGFQHLYKPYYTGWISSWSMHLDSLHTAYSFRYDRLGRLTQANTLAGFNETGWNASLIKNYSTKYSYDLVGNILSLTRYGSDTSVIDVLDYDYYDLSRNNRLSHIDDKVGRVIGTDLDDQDLGNYGYDAVGNMIYDESRRMQVFYTYSNKPRRIKLGNRTIKMKYNPSGYRFFKGSGNNGDIFVYNSQGQLMAKYSINGNILKLDFLPIYEGTERLGMLEVSNIEWQHCPQPWFPPCYLYRTGLGIPEGRVLKASRKYELVDHLGNVRVVITDQRVPVSEGGNTVAYYKPLVKSIHDYYPFGWEKQLTTVNPYPFNYQGQLFDRELGWQYYRYRNYDPVIARFHQVEPLIDSFPWLGYVFSENSVTYGIEIEGLEVDKKPADAESIGGGYSVAVDNTAVQTYSYSHFVGLQTISLGNTMLGTDAYIFKHRVNYTGYLSESNPQPVLKPAYSSSIMEAVERRYWMYYTLNKLEEAGVTMQNIGVGFTMAGILAATLTPIPGDEAAAFTYVVDAFSRTGLYLSGAGLFIEKSARYMSGNFSFSDAVDIGFNVAGVAIDKVGNNLFMKGIKVSNPSLTGSQLTSIQFKISKPMFSFAGALVSQGGYVYDASTQRIQQYNPTIHSPPHTWQNNSKNPLLNSPNR